MAWTLTAGLQNLRTQANARWPNRDKASDGTIGDAAHAAGTSGHNPDDSQYDNAEWDGDSDSISEVRAFDMDTDLREPGTTAQMIVDHIRRLPGVASVLRYIIFNRKIYRASTGFAPEAYTGPSPHTEHIHFSGAWSQAADNNTTFDYRFDEVGDMATALEIVTELTRTLKNPKSELAFAVRAAAWQYGDGVTKAGLPEDGMSMLDLMNALYMKLVTQGAMLQTLAGKLDMQKLATELAPLLPAGTQVTPEAIVEAFRILAARP